MKIGVVKEKKDKENRVSMTPEGVKVLVNAGHALSVEFGAGIGSGFSDQEYQRAGASLVSTESAWDSELVIKVKEPLPSEYGHLQQQMVFTFFHLAGVESSLTRALIKAETTAIAYETLEDEQGRLPILAPMSAVAGNMATQMGSYYLASFNQGKGMQLGAVLGKKYGKVVVVGDGVVGKHAAQVAWGMGAQVFIAGLDVEPGQAYVKSELPGAQYFLSTPESIAEHILDADLVVGAVLCRGAKAPHVITEAMILTMPPGSVVVDVSIDQGGCIETSRPTSHTDPVFVKHDIIHYCVTNMPGAYPRVSTMALSEATLPYIQQIAEFGMEIFRDNPHLAQAINTYDGHICIKNVAESLDMMTEYKSFR